MWLLGYLVTITQVTLGMHRHPHTADPISSHSSDPDTNTSQVSKRKRTHFPPNPTFLRQNTVPGDTESHDTCDSACPGAERGCSSPGVPQALGWLQPSSLAESFLCLAGNQPKQLLKLLASRSEGPGMPGPDVLICQHSTVKLPLSLRQSLDKLLRKERRRGKSQTVLQLNKPCREGCFPSSQTMDHFLLFTSPQPHSNLWSSARQ